MSNAHYAALADESAELGFRELPWTHRWRRSAKRYALGRDAWEQIAAACRMYTPAVLRCVGGDHLCSVARFTLLYFQILFPPVKLINCASCLFLSLCFANLLPFRHFMSPKLSVLHLFLYSHSAIGLSTHAVRSLSGMPLDLHSLLFFSFSLSHIPFTGPELDSMRIHS